MTALKGLSRQNALRYARIVCVFVVLVACGGRNSHVDVTVIEEPIQRDEWAAAYAACMTERGFPSRVEPQADPDTFAIRSDIPPDQEEVFLEVDAQCQESIPPVVTLPPPTPAEWAAVYEGLLSTAECLRDRGYSGDVPRFGVYLESHGDWSPYFWIGALSPSEWNEINRECPEFHLADLYRDG